MEPSYAGSSAGRSTAGLAGLIAVMLAALIALVPASPAAANDFPSDAYKFPSDNDTNRETAGRT